MEKFIEKVKAKFGGYFKGYGVKKNRINVIIDDKDIKYMQKSEAKANTQKVLNELKGKEKINPKAILVSEINNKNVFEILGDSCQVMDVKSITTYINVKLPKGFWQAYDELDSEFKLEDLKKELEKPGIKEYHRNTYQNWLKFLKNAGFVELNNRTYQKIKRIKD